MTNITKNRFTRSISRMSFNVGVLVALAFVGVVSSACDVHGISSPGLLTSITVTPSTTLTVTSTQQMVAVGYDAEGEVVSISPTWSADAGGTINTTGVFSAGIVVGVFENTVVASVGEISGRASITVIEGPLASITVVPNPVTIEVVSAQNFVAVGKDAYGNVVSFTPTWSVVAGGGFITDAGTFTSGGVIGTYINTIQASNNTLRGFATVNVTVGPLVSIVISPPETTLIGGTKQQFTVVGKDISGNVVQFTPTWSVVAGGGTVDSNGLFTAGAPLGTFSNTVKVTGNSLSDFATVVVVPGPLENITVTPNPVTMTLLGAQQFIATGRDVAGNVVPISPTWSVVASGGEINDAGRFIAGTVSGRYTNTIRATSDGISGFATVVVTSGPLAFIVVTPNPVSMAINSQKQFVAVGSDSSGNIIPISPVWSVVSGGGSITGTGLFTSNGTANTYTNTIQAESDEISGNATVVVNAPPPPPAPASPLGSAADYGILAGSEIACAISGSVTGATGPANIGSSPTLTISGFPIPCTFTGIIPLPGVVATAKGDLTVAYLAAQGKVCDLNLSGIDLGFYDGSTPTKTLAPGTYCFSTSAAITGTLKLTGSAAAVWTFQIGSTFDANVGSAVVLAGGAIPDNVYWAVGSSATLKTSSNVSGNIMALASITLQASTILKGRALAQTGSVILISGGTSIIKP